MASLGKLTIKLEGFNKDLVTCIKAFVESAKAFDEAMHVEDTGKREAKLKRAHAQTINAYEQIKDIVNDLHSHMVKEDDL